MTGGLHLTRFSAAHEYEAAGHDGMRCLRVQGMEAGPSTRMWMAISIIAPGGGIAAGASPFEKIYVVLDGCVEVTSGGECVTMHRWDSCRIAPGAERAVANRSDAPATILLAMEMAGPPVAGERE